MQLFPVILILWIVIYPGDTSAIHRINHYPTDNAIVSRNTYPLDSDLSGGYECYPAFEQPGPVTYKD